MRVVIVSAIAVVAAAVGFYAGFFVLLAVTGLGAPAAVPAAGLAGAGLLVGLVAGLGWRCRLAVTAALAAGTAVVGAAVGGLLVWLGLDLGWVIVGGLALVIGADIVAARGSRS